MAEEPVQKVAFQMQQLSTTTVPELSLSVRSKERMGSTRHLVWSIGGNASHTSEAGKTFFLIGCSSQTAWQSFEICNAEKWYSVAFIQFTCTTLQGAVLLNNSSGVSIKLT